MNTYRCNNHLCSDYKKKLDKEVNIIKLNSRSFNTATVCEECGQQLQIVKDRDNGKS